MLYVVYVYQTLLSKARGKGKLEQLLCEQFLKGFWNLRAFLRAKQVEEKYVKIQNPVKIQIQSK